MKKYLYLVFALWLIGIIVILAYRVPLLIVFREHIPDIALLIIILLASYSIGIQFFTLIKLDFNSPLESLPFSTALGLGVLAFCTLLFGLVSLFYKPIFYALLLIPIGLSYKKIIALVQGVWHQCQDTLKQWANNGDYLSFILLFFSLLSLGLSFILSLSPPKFFDILGYHLAIPNQYVIMGKIAELPHSALSKYPFLIHMLYTMALLLKGEILAKLISFSFFPLILVLIYSVSRRFWSSSASIGAMGLIATMPAAMQMAAITMVDLSLAFFLLLAFFSLIYWIQGHSQKWIITSSIFCGLALSIKYTAFFYSLGLLSFLLILLGLTSKKGYKNIVKSLLIFIILAIIISSPWLIKNYIYTGNPFFPIFFKYLGGKNWSIPQEAQLRATTTIKVVESFNPGLILKLPWLWTVEPLRFGLLGSSPGIILLIFLPLVFFYLKKERYIRILLFYCALYIIIWLFTFQQGRFALAMLFCLAIMIGYSIRKFLSNIQHYWRYPLSILLIFFIFINYAILINSHKRIFDPLPYLVGMETREEYLSRTIQSYPAISYINRHLPEDAVILFVGETRNFYCKRICICPSAHDINPICPILKAAATPSKVARVLKQKGISHILFNQPETVRLENNFPVAFDWSPEDKAKLTHFFNSYCEILFQHENTFLLAISEKEIKKNAIP